MSVVKHASSIENISADISTGAFGDDVNVIFTPRVSLKATYGLLDNTETFSATGGSADVNNNLYRVQSGTSVGGYGTIWSREPIVYYPGLGCQARLTAVFDGSALASSTQLAGLFSSVDGMFFGYNGTDFGVMHRYGGEFEIRTYTVTAAATGATINVELNGTTYSVTVAASSTVQEAAHDLEVACLGDAALAAAWRVQHIDDTVVFAFKGSGEKNGAYSITGDATLAGSFARTNAGASPTEDWTTQANWNKNTADWLDVTKGNLYRFEFAYLGFGPLNYYVMHPVTMKWVLVHQVQWPNNNTSPNFGNPSLRVGWASASLGSSGTNLTVTGGSAMAGLEGEPNGGSKRTFGAFGSNTSITTETQILSILVREEFNGKFCNGISKPGISVATDSGKGMIFRVYLNPSVAGDTLHQYVDQSDSISLYDEAGTTVSGGQLIGTYVVGPSGSQLISNEDLGITLIANDELVVTGEVTTGAASGGYVSATIQEII